MSKTKSEVETRIATVQMHLAAMRSYLSMRQEMKDWHGVMDASADIRELETELRVLLWVLSDVAQGNFKEP